MSENKFQTREQRYADAVYKKVDSFAARSEEDRKKYGSMAHTLPVLVRTAGLAQSLAFVEARHKDNSPQLHLLQHLNEVVGKGDLVSLSRSASVSEYMYLTNEVLAALLWFKRYAQSVLNVEASDEAKEGANA